MSEVLAKVSEQAITLHRFPLALIAECKLCGRLTESFSLRRMDPAPQHEKDCVLLGYSQSIKQGDAS